jgi:hypothetical protein
MVPSDAGRHRRPHGKGLHPLEPKQMKNARLELAGAVVTVTPLKPGFRFVDPCASSSASVNSIGGVSARASRQTLRFEREADPPVSTVPAESTKVKTY